MPVRLVITTYAKPGKGAELARAMADRCRAVQPEPGWGCTVDIIGFNQS